jgi:Zn-dependent protease
MEVQKENIPQEILEFAVSVIWLGIAFGISMAGGTAAFKDLVSLRTTIFESLVVVFFAFVLHELAHRITARRYGFLAIYRVWVPGLVLAMITAMFGWLFAAPGGVQVYMKEDTAENRVKLGKCSLAGPIVNLVLAVVFGVVGIVFYTFVQSYLDSTGAASTQLAPWVLSFIRICIMGVLINSWLAFFNLIPWGNFDGFKVFQWNKKVWLVFFIISIAMYVLVLIAQSNF